MKARGWIIGAAMMAVCGAALAGAGAPPRQDTSGPAPVEPVVVELFTAQGCAGCPEANALVADLAERPGLIVLTYAVDYWDYLGWPDTFARPDFAERQRAYRGRLGLRDVYTPQVVVDGARQASGVRAAEVRALVDAEAARRRFPPEVEFRENGQGVGVGSGRAPEAGADVWLVRFEPGPLSVRVGQGENRGQTVSHANVVRGIEHIGDWNGQPVLLPLEPAPGGAATAVLVQSREDGRILAAALAP